MTTGTSDAGATSADQEAMPPGVELLDLEQYLPPMDPGVEALLGRYYGADRLQAIRRALRTAPNHSCLRVNTLRAPAAKVLAELKAEDGPLSPAWGERLLAAAAATAEQQQQQQQQQQVEQGPNAEEPPLAAPVPYLYPTPPLSGDTVLIPSIRVGGLLSSRSEEGPGIQRGKMQHVVVVDRACGEAVLRGANVFAKGVLSASNGIMWGDPVLVLADLHKRVVRGCPWADYAGGAVVVARGRACLTRQQMFRAQTGLVVRITSTTGWLAPPLNDLLPGQVYVQNLPSLVVGHVLCPTLGSTVIDLCACPGGKATHLAALVGSEGLVVACDRTRKKVLELQHLSREMGLDSCLCPLVMDSCKVALTGGKQQDRLTVTPSAVLGEAALDQDGLQQVEGFHPETFDHVLLDPPCSAMGLRPRLILPTKLLELERHVAFQKAFLWSAVNLLKVGGTMTYSTCTINPEENEGMVRYALDAYPCLRLLPAEPRIGGPGLPGLNLSDEERGMVQLFDPSARTADGGLETSGFFVAKFEKVTVVEQKGAGE